MGCIVTDHILHQCYQLLHRGMLALGSTAAAAAVTMAVGVGMTVLVQVVMGVRMVMCMLVFVGMCMGVGMTIMSVFVGMLVGMRMVVGMTIEMFVIDMHDNLLDSFFFYYSLNWVFCQSKYFFRKYPPSTVAVLILKWYNFYIERGDPMDEHTHHHEHTCTHDHDHEYMHQHGIPHSHAHVHENQKAVINRLARAIGHLNKVKRMVEEGYDCSDVLIQLAAVRSALDNTGKVILNDHIRHCMVDAVAAGDQSAIEDLCQAVEKFMK